MLRSSRTSFVDPGRAHSRLPPAGVVDLCLLPEIPFELDMMLEYIDTVRPAVAAVPVAREVALSCMPRWDLLSGCCAPGSLRTGSLRQQAVHVLRLDPRPLSSFLFQVQLCRLRAQSGPSPDPPESKGAQVMAKKGNCIVCVAEGAGQDLARAHTNHVTDASGNPILHDIGTFLRDRHALGGAGRAVLPRWAR